VNSLHLLTNRDRSSIHRQIAAFVRVIGPKPHIKLVLWKGVRRWECYSSRELFGVGARVGTGYLPTDALLKWFRNPHRDH